MISGALLLFGALAFLLNFAGSLATYARESEDVWLSGLWFGLLALTAALCFANAKRRVVPSKWVAFANVVLVLALAALLIAGRDDPTVPPLLLLCAAGPLTAILATWHHWTLKRS